MTKWAKVRTPDEKYDNYQVPLYLDEKSWNLFKESDCQLRIHEDGDGKYVTFKRRTKDWNGETLGPPEINIFKDDKYIPMPEGLIGNGSLVTVRVDVYDTRNGKGHRLVAIGVDKLVEYKTKEEQQLDMPF